MLINEVCQAANLTKKAIKYYIEQGLLSPETLANGYRCFNENDLEILQKVSVLRKLGLSTEEIKSVFADQEGTVLPKIAMQKELNLRHEKVKQTILDQLSTGKNLAEIEPALNALEQGKTITDKLLEAFPGNYGRFICLHFARFLNEPVATPQQQEAYQEIIKFLDEIPALQLPAELQDFPTQTTQTIPTGTIRKINEQTRNAIETPEQFDRFMAEHQEVLTRYLEYQTSDEYKTSPAFKYQRLLKKVLTEFNQASGYYDVFIPALKRLSPAYAKYHQELEAANERLLAHYPELAEIAKQQL